MPGIDLKKFYYLYYKVREEGKDVMLKESEMTEEEFNRFESELAEEVTLLKAERVNVPRIGEDFVRYTRYLYEPESEASKKVRRPDAIAPLIGEIIQLPAVGKIPQPDMTLWKAIEQRRSLRTYAREPLNQPELSFLLWATQWVRDFRSNEKVEIALRNVPSAGARHPFETYLLVNRVRGLKPGLYYYNPTKHGLVLLRPGEEMAGEICRGALDQEMVTASSVTFIWVAVPHRTVWRYSQRGYRYLYLDAGHVGQNLHLAAEAIASGACMIGAFYDEGMNEILKLDGKSAFVIYMASVGKKPV